MQSPWAFHDLTTATSDNDAINVASADLFWGRDCRDHSSQSKDETHDEIRNARNRCPDPIRLYGHKRWGIRRKDGHPLQFLRQPAHANHERPTDALRPTSRRTLHGALVPLSKTIVRPHVLAGPGRNTPRRPFVAFAFAALAACSGTTSTEIAAPANLGEADPAPAFVAEVFDSVCIATLPTYAGATTRLETLGFTPAASGTYYNGRDNISVKLIGSPATECSVVWGVGNDPRTHLARYRDALMEREPLDLSTASFNFSGDLNGIAYFNTRTSAN